MHWKMPLLLLFGVLMIMGCLPKREPLPDGFDIQGHRGAMGLKPENTLPGFFKAVDLGVTTIEFDLAVSEEHKLVISHEPWFRANICLQPDGSPIPQDRERSFRLYEMPYEIIEQFDCGSLQHPSHPGQETLFAVKPLMTEAIEAIDEYVRSQGFPPVGYNIEIKSDPAWDNTLTPEPAVFARLLYEELLALEEWLETPLLDRISVQSFDPRSLHAMREVAPAVPLVLLTYMEGSVDDHLQFFGLEPEIYSPNHGLVTAEHVQRAHELGIRVIPWTVNRKEDMRRLVELGVDGLITDYPNRFNELYHRD